VLIDSTEQNWFSPHLLTTMQQNDNTNSWPKLCCKNNDACDGLRQNLRHFGKFVAAKYFSCSIFFSLTSSTRLVRPKVTFFKVFGAVRPDYERRAYRVTEIVPCISITEDGCK